MLIDIPNQALVNRIIPKNRFKFDDAAKIERIRWEAKLASNTLNIPSKRVIEIEIISIDMPDFNMEIVKEILNKIPQEILFIMNENLAIMQYNNQIFCKKIEENLTIKGFTIDEVRDNFVRQLLDVNDVSEPLEQQVQNYNEIKELEFKIKQINTQIKREVQVNKRQLLARKRYELEKELLNLKGK